MVEPRLSPLHDRHVALGARFAEFGGWSMPLQYASIVAEHEAVRSAVGLFDVSHLGKARVRGAGARDYVNRCLTHDVSRLNPGQAQYTLCCNPEGGVVDDLIVYLRGDDDVFCIPNAANTKTVVELLASEAPQGVEVINEHTDHAVLALQGPRSDEVLNALGCSSAVEYMSFTEAEIASCPTTICRTGYTGERGVEVVCSSADAPRVWDALMAAGVTAGIQPAGLGARDTLRTEMGYPLHGQDLSADITPVMAGLTWAVGWEKPVFWGADVLRAQRADGPPARLRAVKAPGRAIPRPGMAVVDSAGQPLGTVTSGTFSPTLKVGVGLALIDPQITLGDEVGIIVRNRTEVFTVVKPPFVQPKVRQG